jgi:hypothetical protein
LPGARPARVVTEELPADELGDGDEADPDGAELPPTLPLLPDHANNGTLNVSMRAMSELRATAGPTVSGTTDWNAAMARMPPRPLPR